MSIFDNLPNPAAPGMAFVAGIERKRAEIEQDQARGALTAYALNPDDDTAFRSLAEYRPELAIQIGEDRAKRQRDAAVADLQRRAASGDKAAMAELAGIDLEAWDRLDDNNRQAVAQRVEAIGNAALDIASRPAAERPQAWDAYIDQLSGSYPELAEYKGQYSEELLRSAIADAGKMQEFLRSQQPDYQVVPEGGTLVNTRDPAALATVAGQSPPAGQQGRFTFEMYQGLVREGGPQNAASWLERTRPVVSVRTPQEAEQLPPGTTYITPDGQEYVR